jgi:hypothetical protein
MRIPCPLALSRRSRVRCAGQPGLLASQVAGRSSSLQLLTQKQLQALVRRSHLYPAQLAWTCTTGRKACFTGSAGCRDGCLAPLATQHHQLCSPGLDWRRPPPDCMYTVTAHLPNRVSPAHGGLCVLGLPGAVPRVAGSARYRLPTFGVVIGCWSHRVRLRTSSPLRVSEDQEPLPPSSGPGGDRQPSAKVQQLADQICELTMLEVADLTKLLKVRAICTSSVDGLRRLLTSAP